MRGIEKLNPNLQPIVKEFERRCNQKGLNLKITETLRTNEEQDHLYAMGRSIPGKIVTNAKGSTRSSYHQWGLAFDFCKNKRGFEYSYTKEELRSIGKIGKELGLTWGGDFKNIYDPWHFQIDNNGNLKISDLKSNKKPIFPKVKIEEDVDFQRQLSVMKIKGYLSSPEYWILNALSGKVCKGSYVRALIEGMTRETFDTGLKKLCEQGIIVSPEYWKMNSVDYCEGGYVRQLIQNFCKYKQI